MKVAQKKGLQFYQTRSNAIILCNTWPATRIEKVVCMKSREELYNKVHPSPRLPPKSVLKPNLCHGRQDSYNFEARTSVDHQSKEREAHGETRGDSNSYRRTEEFVRRETVKQMIHQFETHPNRESLMADSEKNPKLNPFSEKSKEFIRCMGKTEYFEMCEITSEVHCQDCLLFWEIGIVCCTCGYMLAIFTKESQFEQRSIWCLVNHEFCNKEGTVPWSSTRTNWEATHSFQSSQYTQEGKETWPQHHIGQIPEQPALSRLTKKTK